VKAIRDTAVAGKVIYRSVKLPSGKHSGRRKPKTNLTAEAVQKNNDRLAARDLTLLINANFGEDDAHVTLTYRGDEPTEEQAAKDRRNFVSRLRRQMKKRGEDLKYIVVTEYLNRRIHHHIIVNTQDVSLITKTWGKGRVKIVALDETGQYKKLGEYLIKETTKTIRDPESMHKRRYTASRNLVRPVIKREIVNAQELSEDPKPIPGYYIPKDMVRRYEHPVTGVEHLEYYMVAEGEPRKYKVWPRGQAVPGTEHFRPDPEEQEELDLET
jgi:hypothetical protein